MNPPSPEQIRALGRIAAECERPGAPWLGWSSLVAWKPLQALAAAGLVEHRAVEPFPTAPEAFRVHLCRPTPRGWRAIRETDQPDFLSPNKNARLNPRQK